MEFTIERAVLELHKSASTDKSRPNLAGVWLEPSPDGNGSLATATDGHIMARIRSAATIGADLFIPTSAAKDALRSSKGGTFTLQAFVDGSAQLKADNGACFPCPRPDHGHPDFARVAGLTNDNEVKGVAYFDARLLLLACQQAIALHQFGKREVGLMLELPEPGHAARLSGFAFSAVIMPIRSSADNHMAWEQAFPTVEPRTDTLKRDDIHLPASAAA